MKLRKREGCVFVLSAKACGFVIIMSLLLEDVHCSILSGDVFLHCSTRFGYGFSMWNNVVSKYNMIIMS